MIPSLIRHIGRFGNSTAIVESSKIYSYEALDSQSNNIANELERQFGKLKSERIILIVSAGFNYCAALFAIWKCGATAVPIFIDLPANAIEYYIEDSGASIVIADDYRVGDVEMLNEKVRIINLSQLDFDRPLPYISEADYEDDALIIYTSGTTSKPKGVLTTHRILEAQVTTLVESWEWTSEDSILNVLPLHHVHGLVNALLCPLFVGAEIHILTKFDAPRVLQLLSSGQINVFMAVPTIYSKLISAYELATKDEKLKMSAQLKSFRLMVSGSAALPVSVLEKWKTISGHFLLERYGMTEIGMAISNPYRGERKAGFVGLPLPGVQVRLFDNDCGKVAENEEAGEIQIKSPAVFKSYWKKHAATAETFTKDGWFKTGDLAVCIDGYYKILGRLSSDIIKSGGYKLSAIEIEECLREHPSLADVAVLAIPDEIWGETVVAVVVLKDKESIIDAKSINEWLSDKLPVYKIPKKYRFVDELPRNAMGKIVKNSLKELF
jgi:malonyl-CoA/methylmalonyl-CoA synthetase